jgi:hypothetical protein
MPNPRITWRAGFEFPILSPSGRTAWLDEKPDNDDYGQLRGTGVRQI